MKTPLSFFNKSLTKPVLLSLLLATGTAFAQAPQKIAVLDMAAALFNSNKAKAVDQELQTATSEDVAKIRALADEATKLEERRQKDAAVMSAEDARKVQEQIQEKGVQYQFLVEKVQKLQEERRQQFQQANAQSLIKAIQDVIDAEKYDMVLRAEAVLHFTGGTDITAKVTEKLNAQP